jgi:hypothetical protein
MQNGPVRLRDVPAYQKLAHTVLPVAATEGKMSIIHDTQFLDTPQPVEAKPLSVVEQGKLNASDFERLKRALLDPVRHQNNIGGRDRVNAAGWQVLGAAMKVSVVIISHNAQGTPGAFRELLEDAKGKKVVSYSVTVRATCGSVIQERTGRCDSSETKHSQSEHKLESVAFTRAFNRATCAILGGEPGDNADEVEDEIDQARNDNDKPARVQIPVSELIALHAAKGAPEGKLGQWLAKALPGFNPGAKLTPHQSIHALHLLEQL